jgi:hypothetical protein
VGLKSEASTARTKTNKAKGKMMTAPTKSTLLYDVPSSDIGSGNGIMTESYRLCSLRGGDGLSATISQWGAWAWTVERLEEELLKDVTV